MGWRLVGNRLKMGWRLVGDWLEIVWRLVGVRLKMGWNMLIESVQLYSYQFTNKLKFDFQSNSCEFHANFMQKLSKIEVNPK